jgi:hypothetical protein
MSNCCIGGGCAKTQHSWLWCAACNKRALDGGRTPPVMMPERPQMVGWWEKYLQRKAAESTSQVQDASGLDMANSSAAQLAYNAAEKVSRRQRAHAFYGNFRGGQLPPDGFEPIFVSIGSQLGSGAASDVHLGVLSELAADHTWRARFVAMKVCCNRQCPRL